MIALSTTLATALDIARIPIFSGTEGFTKFHQFAVCAEAFGGGQSASKTLRNAGFLACGIGLPIPPVKWGHERAAHRDTGTGQMGDDNRT